MRQPLENGGAFEVVAIFGKERFFHHFHGQGANKMLRNLTVDARHCCVVPIYVL
jgi:hypothetical protein